MPAALPGVRHERRRAEEEILEIEIRVGRAGDNREREWLIQPLTEREANDGQRGIAGAVDMQLKIGHGSAPRQESRFPAPGPFDLSFHRSRLTLP